MVKLKNLKARFMKLLLGTLQYMYANGRYLRPATLKDVENAQDWDVETVQALVGNGYYDSNLRLV